jgi:glycerol-3-phosphate dehydrogenase (NAD(P)+)
MKSAVVGGGSWGSAFAIHLGRQNIPTRIWIREKDVFEETRKYRENKTFLPGTVFPSHVDFSNDLEEALEGAEVVFIVVPSDFCRDMYQQMKPFISQEQVIVSLTKGIENQSLKRMSELMQDIFGTGISDRMAVLSGPSFAREVAESHPTAVVIAAHAKQISRTVQHLVSNPCFRAYSSDDVTGVELAASVKNVMAIAAGISDGLEYGLNSLAALITRGIAEITRLGKKMGANPGTFAGLAGIGDLVLTCTGKLSRNRYVGHEIGKGKSLEEVLSGMRMVAEGVTTTQSVRNLAQKMSIEMPICEQVYQVLYQEKEPRRALQDLMTRELKEEKMF